MRAKFRVTHVEKVSDACESITMTAVTEKPFDSEGNSEDNSFARWTPTGDLKISVTNPNLFGKIQAGEKYYLDFSKAEN